MKFLLSTGKSVGGKAELTILPYSSAGQNRAFDALDKILDTTVENIKSFFDGKVQNKA